MRSCLLTFSLLFAFYVGKTQKDLPGISLLTTGTNTSLRGLSVVNDQVVWVSGSNGTVGKSNDGGKDWKWFKVRGFEKADFRDIEAFDASTAVIMAVDAPAYILKTVDGGESWRVVYENKLPGMFLDAMEFWNEQAGIVVGDPIDQKFFIARTFDGGSSWAEIPVAYRPVADTGEACFAASGTNIRALDLDEAVFVSGGRSSHLYIKNDRTRLPITQGSETTGAYSVAVWDHYKRKGGDRMIVVGGDYAHDTVTAANCFYTTNRGRSWQAATTNPHGYRSCVEFLSKKIALTCGTSGVDLTTDGGANWILLTGQGFNTCRIAKLGSSAFLVGQKGAVAKLILPEKFKKDK
jgi:photosystem II stability/assembly factor-like uncharacterized protein